MKDYKQEIAERLYALDLIKEANQSEQDIYSFIEQPKDAGLGDFALPCFRFSKALSKPPNAIATEMAEAFSIAETGDLFSAIATGPYLNIFVNREVYGKDVLTDVLTKGDSYGGSEIGKDKRILVEFSSPNIAKPFHIGHIRSTVIGSSISKILAFIGYDVIKLNHLGDYGTQFGKLIVAYRRFGSRQEVEASPIQTLLKYYVEFHKLAENDPSLEVEARAAFASLERGEEEERALWEWFREESLKEFTVVYDMMGIDFDSYDGESFFSDKMDRFITELNDKGLLETSDGAEIVDLDDSGLGKALVKKSDGSTLYITRDIAAAVYRKEHYGFYKNVYVVASQQDLHFKQWIKILELMNYEWANDCIHVPFGLVRLADGTMQTRTGNVVFLEDVLRKAIEKAGEIIEEKGVVTDDHEKAAIEIGIGAVVYQELSNNRIKDYVFNWDKVLSFEGETGPYVQYNHARACSVLQKAKDAEINISHEALLSAIDFSATKSESAFLLLKLIGVLPDVILEAAEKFEPSLITRHVTDIAQAFSVFYHDEPILSDTGDSRLVKLAIAAATKQAIKNGLTLICVNAPERM